MFSHYILTFKRVGRPSIPALAAVKLVIRWHNTAKNMAHLNLYYTTTQKSTYMENLRHCANKKESHNE